MAHSNSSINCYLTCAKKYDYTYVQKLPPCTPPSPHLTFGAMAHKVLENAGRLRDECNAGVVAEDEYMTIIPSEVDALELKEYFNINSWEKYFVPIVKATAKYEREQCDDFLHTFGMQPIIEREVKLSMRDEDALEQGLHRCATPIVGVIDLLLVSRGNGAYIFDYKFSNSRKNQSNFDMDSQLSLYAYLVHKNYNVPLRNIKVGYIDIPKMASDRPAVLKNGTLSRAKSQNVTQEDYARAVLEQHGDDIYYNCEPGGYYYDIYCELALNKPAYINYRFVEEDTVRAIVKSFISAARFIETAQDTKMPFLARMDAYTCVNCEYREICKPWTKVNFEE